MKAIALISGGLDSTLAAKLIHDLGIEVIPLTFQIPFCHKKKSDFSSVSSSLGVELRTIKLEEDFLEILKGPGHGFGSQMNPCIDCKILMLSKAKELMAEWGASFVITGEVLGQRPMSQHRHALDIIASSAGLEGLVLRPLSAKLLLETTPEKMGWVLRDRLLDFNGRGRSQQMKLAKTLGIEKYAQPAGGCLLTDPQFSKRLKELILHRELSLGNVDLLKIGRHFRLSESTKLVVGRDEKENEQLANLAKAEDYLFMPKELPGPTSLGRGLFNADLIQLASVVTCSYCDLNGSNKAEIVFRKAGKEEILHCEPIGDKEILPLKI